jgi:hypothetical protein
VVDTPPSPAPEPVKNVQAEAHAESSPDSES